MAIGALLAGLIASLDCLILPAVPLGILYLLPIILVSGSLTRWQTVLVAVVCTFLRERLGPFPLDADAPARMATGFLVFVGAGLFVGELVRNRLLVVEHLREVEEQARLRQEAEEQLRVLIESSPAAILTIDANGQVLLANEAAHRLLDVTPQSLIGQAISSYLPALAAVLRGDAADDRFRTTIECKGRRRNGEVFFAHVWFSTYRTQSGPRVAAIVLDASEALRDREELGVQLLRTSSRILVSAVSHEVRNLAGAIAVLHANLSRVPLLTDNEDFRALGSLVEGLKSVASAELRPAPEGRFRAVDLQTVLDELRVVIEPSFREVAAELRWDVPDSLPEVWADRQGLLQVFLNLAQNSLRAIDGATQKQLAVETSVESDRVYVRFRDTGPGVASPENLFKPLRGGSDTTGLGLYVSRGILRTFAGDLRHEPQAHGCCFAVELARSPVGGASKW